MTRRSAHLLIGETRILSWNPNGGRDEPLSHMPSSCEPKLWPHDYSVSTLLGPLHPLGVLPSLHSFSLVACWPPDVGTCLFASVHLDPALIPATAGLPARRAEGQAIRQSCFPQDRVDRCVAGPSDHVAQHLFRLVDGGDRVLDLAEAEKDDPTGPRNTHPFGLRGTKPFKHCQPTEKAHGPITEPRNFVARFFHNSGTP